MKSIVVARSILSADLRRPGEEAGADAVVARSVIPGSKDDTSAIAQTRKTTAQRVVA
jgi:hypothetical protein